MFYRVDADEKINLDYVARYYIEHRGHDYTFPYQVIAEMMDGESCHVICAFQEHEMAKKFLTGIGEEK